MALFSRRRRPDADTPSNAPESVAVDVDAADAARATESGAAGDARETAASMTAAPTSAPADADVAAAAPASVSEPSSAPGADAAVPTVGISVSSYRGAAGATATPAPRTGAVPDSPAETVPGMRDNVLLRDALATLGADPTPGQLVGVTRQLLQGHLFLLVQGDARALLGAGKEVAFAIANDGDDKWILAFSSGAALQRSIQADGRSGVSAMAQPVSAVFTNVLSGGYAGVIIDPASAPARLVLSRDLIERAASQADPAFALKTLLAGPRTAETAAELGRAMVAAPLYVAVNRAEPDESGEERVGIAEGRDADGSRILEIYSHPLEVVAMERGDQPLPFTPRQLASALSGHDELVGVVLDPAGPWIRLGREDLAPVLALADL